MDSATKAYTRNQLSALPIPDTPIFFLNQLSECDVKKNILAITSNSVGSDSISRKMIIPLLDILTPVLTSIFNTSISTCTFPSIWKDAEIVPLPKKTNPTSLSEYRPISILPFLSKALERLVHQQLSSFLVKHRLLNPMQSGFRPGHSTTTALVKITDDIRSNMDNQRLTVLTLLDFSNAFNTVDFDILCDILRSLNISPEVADWFLSYLQGRRQRVKLNDSYSNWSTVNTGVPQGGVLSPLLFSIFINSLCNVITSFYHLYADDLQIYSHSTVHNLSQCVSRINNDLLAIGKWSKAYGLHINPNKSKAIIIGSSKLLCRIDKSELPPVTFNGFTIPYSENVRNLGVIFDQHLSWGPQICEISRRLFASVGSLRRLRNLLPIPTKIALAHSLLLPILDYADTCYLDITEEQLNKLERIQNLCIRFIFGLRKYDHISEFRKKLKWLPIRLRRNAHILNLLYSILFNPFTPSYLKERFQFLGDTHERCLRSDSNFLLAIPSHSSSFYDKSFTVQASRLWNTLPLNIRRVQTLATFKKTVRKHFLETQQ